MQPVTLRNLTPHRVNVRLGNGTEVILEPELPTPRCDIERVAAGSLLTQFGAIPLTTTRLAGGVRDLPAPRTDTWLVVPRVVVEAAPERSDLLFPDDLIRDPDTGRVVACRALGRS